MVYVYECTSCDVIVEERRPISRRDDPVPCPLCGDACSRGVTTFSISSGAASSAQNGAADTVDPNSDAFALPRRHRAGCLCCQPRSSKKKTLAMPVGET